MTKYNIGARKKAIISVMFVLILIIGLLIPFVKIQDKIYMWNYFVDSICLIISCFLLLKLYITNGLDIFEPITIIGILYIVMYFFAPIYDLIIGEYTWFGYDVFKFGIKATLIAFLGFLIFYFFYTHKLKFKNRENIKTNVNNYITTNREILLIAILVMYIFSLGANIFYLVKYSGSSVLYLLTLGVMGSGSANQISSGSIGFISMFSYCLPTITLLYWEYGKSKTLKIILFVPMFMLQVSRGFRFFIIQIVITFFAYYFLKKNKRPKVLSIIGILIIVLIPIIIMTLFRNSIRSGMGMNITNINMELIKKALDAAIWENFRVYRNYYAMVDKIPSTYPYVYGRQMIIGTLIMLIPRAIWPGKISTQAGVGLEYIVGFRLKGTGQAYPNIGEYYYALGILGVVICMAIYGIWARKLKNRYLFSKDGVDIILYAVLLGSNLQLIIRGYTPSNFWYLVFSVIPVLIIKKLRKIKLVEAE